MRKINLTIKRGLDFILTLVGTIITSPVILVISILIKCTSKGPVFFKQERLGLHGRPFRIIKFRTMVVNAEHMGTGVVINEKDDPRVTKIGRFLRSTSLDELPQVFNVLKGDMVCWWVQDRRLHIIHTKDMRIIQSGPRSGLKCVLE